MAKWSVALYGHDKPRYYMIEREYNVRVATFVDPPKWDPGKQQWADGLIIFPISAYELRNVTGWEKRAAPGDIIAYKEWKPDIFWSPTERREFLIVTIDGPTEQHTESQYPRQILVMMELITMA